MKNRVVWTMAAALSLVPVVNLIVPVLAIACMAHVLNGPS